MNYGFVKAAAAVPEVRVGDCDFNSRQMQDLLFRAAKEQAEIVVFPELAVTGYTCADLFRQRLLLDKAEEALAELVAATAKLPLLCAVGLPVRAENALYNCAVIFQKGKILGAVPKTFLPNYAEFYEKRWFRSGAQLSADRIWLAGQEVPFGTDLLFACGDAVVGVEICEDLWVPVPPSSLQALAGANIILNLSASPEAAGKHAYLKSLICQQSARCCAGYVYASAGFGESSTDLVFAGNGFIAENGVLLREAARFQTRSQLIYSEIDVQRLQAERLLRGTFSDDAGPEDVRVIAFVLGAGRPASLSRKINPLPFVPAEEAMAARCEEILSMQAHGLARRLAHTGAQTAVIGVSGGLDSTLALLVTARAFDMLALPRKGILGVTMPCFGTTDRTYQNALSLMKALKVTAREVDIKASVTQHLKDIAHPLSGRDVTYENAQARERTQVLMDLANQSGGLVIGTGDLSELALGWATYNGDHMSMYGVNAGVPKTLVRHLTAYAAQTAQDTKLAAVLRDILATPVSPELLPPSGKNISQKTEDLVGPYELHDFFLYYFLRFGFPPKKIYWLAAQVFKGKYAAVEIKKCLKVFVRRFLPSSLNVPVCQTGQK